MSLDQVVIMLLGVLAAWVSQDPRERTRRWACVLGLVAQPFWFWASWKAGQWGIFALSLGYTAAYLRGGVALCRSLRGDAHG